MHEFVRIGLLLYFFLHIPVTLIVDAQGLLGTTYHPQWAQRLLSWYLTKFGDHLMGTPPTWFKSIILLEVTLQLPFFIFIIIGLVKKKNWTRLPCIIYSTHTATTVFPILAELLYFQGTTTNQKIFLLSVYSPFLLVPLSLLWFMIVNPVPFHCKEV
jgi:hypothetical protein